MATIQLSGHPMIYPDGYLSFYSPNALTIDAEGEKLAFIFQFPKTGTLKKVIIKTQTITTGGTLTARLETVDLTTGDPTGTLYDASGTGTCVIANTDDNIVEFIQINSTTGISVTAYDLVAFVLTAPAGFVGNINAYGASASFNYPYVELYTTSWAKTQAIPLIALEYDGEIIAPCGTRLQFATGFASWNSSSNPNRRGARFHVDLKGRLVGVVVMFDLECDCTFYLFDSDGATALATVSLDSHIRSSASGGQLTILFSPVTLEKDTNYYFAFLPSTTTDVALYGSTITKDGALNPYDSFPSGRNFELATCNGAPTGTGDWTVTDTSRVIACLLIDQIIEPDGGGLMRNPGMDGGCNT